MRWNTQFWNSRPLWIDSDCSSVTTPRVQVLLKSGCTVYVHFHHVEAVNTGLKVVFFLKLILWGGFSTANEKQKPGQTRHIEAIPSFVFSALSAQHCLFPAFKIAFLFCVAYSCDFLRHRGNKGDELYCSGAQLGLSCNWLSLSFCKLFKVQMWNRVLITAWDLSGRCDKGSHFIQC